MIFRSIVVVMTLAASSISSAKVISWGKPGATQQEYEEGSQKCSLIVARADVSTDPIAQAYVAGFEALERENNMPPMPIPQTDDPTVARSNRQTNLKRLHSPDRNVSILQKRMQDQVDNCLKSSGYTRFLLTKEQESILSKLKIGSRQRKLYLFDLGTNKDIITLQKVNYTEK